MLPATLAQRIADMDAQGIDMEALSINAYWYGAEREVAQKICQIQNERLAEVCARTPERFVAFASVALQHPELAAGFRYAYGFLPTRSALLLLSAVSFGIQPYQSLAPYFARDVFHGGSETLGYLIGAGGFGAVSGMVYLAMKPSVRGLLSLIPFTAGTAGAALIAFSFAHTLWLALPMLFLAGMGAMLSAASTNTVLQTIVEDRMRARVVSIYMMSFLGVTPLGALCAGMRAERIGPPTTLALGGTFTLLAAFAYWMNLGKIRQAIRPLYQKLGIVPRGDE